MNKQNISISVVFPCLNESPWLEGVLKSARGDLENTIFEKHEIIVADNCSSDDSQDIARLMGARVVEVRERGYGAALKAGIHAASYDYIVMLDADGSYDLGSVDLMFELMTQHHLDLVVGNRFKGTIAPNAMPFLNRYVGNPFLSLVGRSLFTSAVRDYHCGVRLFKKSKITKLNIQSSGMEFASEMIIAASKQGLNIGEIPVNLKKDLRDRKPHLRPFRDGMRHLSLMLQHYVK